MDAQNHILYLWFQRAYSRFIETVERYLPFRGWEGTEDTF